ncbi:MAG: DMT family transporter [Devosiaceae bacterium]|nr:DMT family transporter [Devosiaceae bacterium MH13]
MVTAVKFLGDTVPVGQIVFFRAVVGLIPIAIMIQWQHTWSSALKTKRPFSHAGRALIGATAMTLWFLALARLPLPDATAISFAQPLMTTALAVVLLGEVVRLYRWSAILIGFVGVLIVLAPNLGLLGAVGDDTRMLGALFAFGSACFMALAQVFVRQMITTETTTAIVFYFSALTAVFSLATAPFGWVLPDAGTLGLLVFVGLLGGVGQIALTHSYRFAPASVVAPFDYTAMIFAVLIGLWLFDEVPTPLVLVGSVLVVGAGLFVIYREHVIGIRREDAKSARTPS